MHHTIGCSAVGAARFEAVWDEPLTDHVSAVVRYLVLGLVLALDGVAAVAAVSLLVAEAARGREGHDPTVVHCNSAVRVCLMKSSKLFVCVWHYVRIAKSFLQMV